MKWNHLEPYEDWFWVKNRIELKKAWVETIDFDKKILRFSAGDPVWKPDPELLSNLHPPSQIYYKQILWRSPAYHNS